jgi:hypothetical protein
LPPTTRFHCFVTLPVGLRSGLSLLGDRDLDVVQSDQMERLLRARLAWWTITVSRNACRAMGIFSRADARW